MGVRRTRNCALFDGFKTVESGASGAPTRGIRETRAFPVDPLQSIPRAKAGPAKRCPTHLYQHSATGARHMRSAHRCPSRTASGGRATKVAVGACARTSPIVGAHGSRVRARRARVRRAQPRLLALVRHCGSTPGQVCVESISNSEALNNSEHGVRHWSKVGGGAYAFD